MRNYRPSTATEHRVFFGAELAAGLRLFAETDPLADPFDALTDQLDAAHDVRQAAKKPMARSRAKRRFAAHTLRRCVRSAAHAAEIADGGRRGPIFGAVFPGGLRQQLSTGNVKLVRVTEALLDRLAKSKVTGIDTFRAEWTPKVSAALLAMKQSTMVFDAARSAHQDAFSTERALRDQHRVEVDRIMGRVRAAFPGDTDSQDLIFPDPEADDTADDENEDETAAAEDEDEPKADESTPAQPPASNQASASAPVTP